MNSPSIKQKLMLITMASSAVGLLLVAAAFLSVEFFSFREGMQSNLSTLAEIIGDQSTAALTYNDPATAEENLKSLASKKTGIVAACIYTKKSAFASYRSPELGGLLLPAQPGQDEWRFANGYLSGFQPIYLNGEQIGSIYICSNLDQLHDLLWHYATVVLWLFISSLFVVYLFASRLQRIISRPISHLAQTAKIVTQEKNYSIRAQKTSDDELGLLIDGFNSMLAQIQQRDAALNHSNVQLENRVAERTQDLQQQFGRISLLNQITYAIAARQDFESIILVVIQQLEDHLPVDYAVSRLFDETTGTLKNSVRGSKTHALAARMGMPQQTPIIETAFADCAGGEMVYIPDISRLELALAKKFMVEGIRSGIGLPLVIDGKMFGLIILMRHEVDGFSLAEREFLRGLSAHITVAIQQVQLYQHLSKAYDELRKTQQVAMQQERLKALGQMASGIAHDINNALSPIVGFAELIQRMETNLSADSKKQLNYIRTSGEDIAHIVAGLREFYRLREENEALHPLDLNRIVEQAIDMTAPRWRNIPLNHGITMEVRKDLDPLLPELAGIQSEIREALTNLILNAADALPLGGTIILRTRRKEGQVILEVIDNGVGMDEATRKRCIEPFFSTKGRRGTGLGLAMVYGIMERHAGRIEIESEPGRGTTMRLVFPALRADSPAEPEEKEAELPAPANILFIDDEANIRELMQQILRQDGHQVEVADGGKNGVAQFLAARETGRPFDAVMTDLGMPGMDGREVAARIKRESPATPIIMLTGWGAFMKEDAQQEVEIVLSKPPRINEIRAALQRFVTPAGDHSKS
jgi:signal transduction histidine kinase/ActR/RegA family two-component response regulator